MQKQRMGRRHAVQKQRGLDRSPDAPPTSGPSLWEAEQQFRPTHNGGRSAQTIVSDRSVALLVPPTGISATAC